MTPSTGTYAITRCNELHGMEFAVEQINAKGGILGRPAKLIVEDSTSGDAGVAVQKACWPWRPIPSCCLMNRRLHRKHKLIIVLVEHDMRVIFNLADRITVLAEGEVLDRGTPDEIAASEKVQVAYLGEKREGT